MTMDNGGPPWDGGGSGCSVKGCLGLGIFLIAIATVVITLIALV